MLIYRVTKVNYTFYNKIQNDPAIPPEEVFTAKFLKDRSPPLTLYEDEVLSLFRDYIRTKKKHKKGFSPLSIFFARIYTNLYYNVLVMLAIFGKTSAVLLIIQIVFYFSYFLKVNRRFLNTLSKEKIEEKVDLKMDYFWQKNLSYQALSNGKCQYDLILEDEKFKHDEKKPLFRNFSILKIREYLTENLLRLS